MLRSTCGAFPLFVGGATLANIQQGFELHLPNFVDPFPTKYLRIQVTMTGDPSGSIPISVGVDGVDADDPNPVETNLGPGPRAGNHLAAWPRPRRTRFHKA